MAYRNYRRKSTRRAYKKKRAYKPKRASFKQKVQRVIVGMAEHKQLYFTADNLTLNYTTSPSVGYTLADNMTSLIPTIDQGDNINARTGNEIKVISHYANVILGYSLGANASTDRPFYVRLFVGRLKASGAAPTGSDFQKFCFTNTTSSGYDIFYSTVPQSLMQPVNVDKFTIIYDKVHKIGTSNANTSSNGASNNDYQLSKMFKINLTKFTGGVWKYTQSGDNTPNNRALYMWAGVVIPDGSTSSTKLCFLKAGTHVKYIDM